jgi:hypothetical protein
MSSVVKTQITLNAKSANWLLNEVTAFVADRQISQSHVAKLVAEMQEGHFLPEVCTLAVAKLGDKTYRLNGQHTATAVLKAVESDENFEIKDLILLTYQVKSDKELRELYARIDRGASRSTAQVTASILTGTSEFEGVNQRILNLLPIGLSIWQHEHRVQRSLHSGENAANDVQGRYLSLSQTVSSLMGDFSYQAKHHGHVFRGPVVAAMYATFDKDSEDAAKFWRAVATGVGFQNESEPAARLRQTLQHSTISGGNIRKGDKAVYGSEDLFRVCLGAWNRFRDGASFGMALQPTKFKSRPVVK